MVAERRDLIVATYSSVCGTCDRSTVLVLTGSACCGGCFASVLLQPELERTAKPNNRTERILFKSSSPKRPMRYRCSAAIERCRICLPIGLTTGHLFHLA